jgi:serine/threonine protein kinase
MADGEDREEEEASSPVAAGDLLLGRYRVLEEMAEGGHSLVFRLEDERLRRQACAKVLHRSGIDPRLHELVERTFVHEAFVLGRLSHPGILQIYDFGYLPPPADQPDRGQVPVQICELVSGGPLSRWVKQHGRLEPHDVLAVVLPLCRALAEVHAHGLVHLDVKPQNVLLVRTATGRLPKLADFGISRAVDTPALEGASSVLMFSVNWAAPEQMVGDPVLPASDVYSLALLTLYALTGQVLFHEQDPSAAYRLRTQSSQLLRDTLAPFVLPAELSALLLWALSFDPTQRVQGAMEFARLLAEALELDSPFRPPIPALAMDEVSSSPWPGGDVPAADRSLPGRVTAASVWSLSIGQPCPDIAGRKVRFLPLAPAAELSPDDRLRLRVSFIPSSPESVGLHIQGLNCFVALAGRRPSGALTLDTGGTLEVCSARGQVLARAEVTLATHGRVKNVLAVAGQTVVVPNEECNHLAALDFGRGSICALAYDDQRAP